MRWWDVAPVMELELVLFPDQPWSAETFWAELALGTDRLYLVAEEGVAPGDERAAPDQGPTAPLLGYAGLSCPAEARGADAEVMTIAVAPAAQQQGIGRLLLAALIEGAQQRGASRLLLEVRADNVAAKSLYAATGFDQIGSRAAYYHGSGPDGRTGHGVDALILSLRLPDRPVGPDSVAP
jgi:[ribosomal protein S18]-alanine N-acetyltransferase